MSKKKQRNIIIIGLASVVLLMAIGYAAFSTVLKIDGTSKISSTWDIQITGITKDKTKGNVTEISEPTFDKESATFSVGLESPGDYIYYKVAVTNKGTLAAIAKLGKLSCGDNNVIECGAYATDSMSYIESNTDLTNKRLIIGPNETEYYSIWIKYNPAVVNQPTTTVSNIKLTLVYEQSDVGITHQTEDKCYTGKVLDNGTISIADYDKSCGPEVVVPETIDGYTVTRIANGGYDSVSNTNISPFANKGITSVVIPDTVTIIGTEAFIGNKITSLDLGNGVEVINAEAFTGNKLTSLVLPSSLKSMANYCFGGNNLTEINIPSTVTNLGGGIFTGNNVTGENAFIYARNSDGSINYSVLDSYAGRAADNIVLPPNITTLSYRAFTGVAINTLEIPSTIKSIGGLAFYGAGIKSLKLNEGLETIGYRAFGSNKLTNVNIPNSVKTIDRMAFHSNPLETVNIGSGIKTIGNDAFNTLILNPVTININRKEGSVTGSPWGATKAQINWTGTN